MANSIRRARKSSRVGRRDPQGGTRSCRNYDHGGKAYSRYNIVPYELELGVLSRTEYHLSPKTCFELHERLKRDPAAWAGLLPTTASAARGSATVQICCRLDLGIIIFTGSVTPCFFLLIVQLSKPRPHTPFLLHLGTRRRLNRALHHRHELLLNNPPYQNTHDHYIRACLLSGY